MVTDYLKLLTESISKVAPLVGGSLGGPVGGAVISLLSKALGAKSVDPKDLLEIINNDSESAVKIKQIETDYQIALLNAQSTDLKTEVDDRKDARSHFSTTWQQFVLACIYLIFFSTIIIMAGMGYIHLDERLTGVLEAAMMTILVYYFGASYRATSNMK